MKILCQELEDKLNYLKTQTIIGMGVLVYLEASLDGF